MLGYKVVYTSVAPIEIDIAGFKDLNCEFLAKPCPTEDEIIEFASDAYAAIIRSEPCTKRVIDSFKECRLIMTPKVGFDNIDVAAATEAGICVANMKGLSVDEVSDHAMALILACSRKLLRLDKMVRAGQWHTFHGKEMQAMWKGISLMRGQTLGIIGFGAIARTLVTKAKVFGLNIAVYDPYITDETVSSMDARRLDLNTLLSVSDYISLHIPLTPATKHMLGEEQFKLMKRTAYIINTSRGSVIDEKALYKALHDGYIAGAGLDVTEKEPINLDNPLLRLENVILTGHSAHYSDQVWDEQAKRPAQEVARIISGHWPLSWVNPAAEINFKSRWKI